MKYKILTLDLDGTLTNSKKEITEPTKKALIEIQEQGKKVVLASGRPTQGIIPLACQLHLKDYGSYILSFNGGHIIDCRTGEVIYNKTLPEDCLKPLYEIVSQYRDKGVDIISYGNEKLISGICPNEYTRLESKINNTPIFESKNFLEDVKGPQNKFLITGEPEVIKEIQEKMIKHFRSYLNIYCSEPFFLEIMPQGIDKAHSLLRLLNSIGLTADEMICCGDGYNDLTMIETAGLGVAMANAQPEVLEKADYITKSNDEDGVLHVINRFMRD
ncbi:MAG: Cof-type HAD-IIB family hydrolase [Eubacteriales bacterium]|nr:Cof-type HAD-IIB family hydrolase [Eubacteriales bacterium]